MPPSSHTATQSSHRRLTASARQRENRTQHTQTSNMRRRKSRSPDARILEEIPAVLMAAESGNQRRKRKSMSSSAASINEPVTQPSIEEVLLDRGRRGKAKARPQTSFVEEGDTRILREFAAPSGNTRSKRKERSKSRDNHPRGVRTTTPDPGEDVDVGTPVATFDSTEFARLKREIESLRKVRLALLLVVSSSLSMKQMHMSKKTIHKQSKVRHITEFPCHCMRPT